MGLFIFIISYMFFYAAQMCVFRINTETCKNKGQWESFNGNASVQLEKATSKILNGPDLGLFRSQT